MQSWTKHFTLQPNDAFTFRKKFQILCLLCIKVKCQSMKNIVCNSSWKIATDLNIYLSLKKGEKSTVNLT